MAKEGQRKSTGCQEGRRGPCRRCRAGEIQLVTIKWHYNGNTSWEINGYDSISDIIFYDLIWSNMSCMNSSELRRADFCSDPGWGFVGDPLMIRSCQGTYHCFFTVLDKAAGFRTPTCGRIIVLYMYDVLIIIDISTFTEQYYVL